jgi:transcriptional regulator with XRE-family HTH domain
MEFDLGKRIKSIRLERKLSILKLARETGFSPGLLSQIENNIVSPPISTLAMLAKALRVKIGAIFNDEDGEPAHELVRVNERKRVNKVISRLGTKHGYYYEALSWKKKNKKMEPFLVTIKTDVLDEKSVYSHEGEEFLMVLKGKAELIYDGERIALNEGDAVYFDSSIKHRLLSNEVKPAKVLAVLTK